MKNTCTTLVFLACFFCVKASQATQTIALSDILLPNGTIDASTRFSGPVNFQGYQVELDPCLGPVFMPALVAPGWNAVASGINCCVVNAIAISGSDIYVGGFFTDAGGNSSADHIARWNGSAWIALGTGLNNSVWSIAISGSNVYVGGDFTNAGGNSNANYVARWNGTTWNALGTGLNAQVAAMAITGSDVYVGGAFTDAGGNANADFIARWNGSSWNSLGSTALNNSVYAISISGSNIYTGGNFTDAGGNTNADYIARWNGTSWIALGSGLFYGVSDIAVSGNNVYVTYGSSNGYVSYWDGSNWNDLGFSFNEYIWAIGISGSDIYVGGNFTDAGGNANADYIARWNGTAWVALGTGLNGPVNVITMVGADVYAGGGFTDAGGNAAADKIARWENGPLPVELIEIAANRTANNINLTWRTASETQNAHFLVQHSTDGRIFHALAQIPGQGNSYQENSYEYLHENPSPGTNYYRLKQVDFDGQFEYSKTVSVKMESDDFDIHPNPTSGILQITGKEDPTGGGYFVKDSMGRLLQSGRLESREIDISGLNTGIYLLEIRLEERVLVKRVVRQ